MPGARLSGSGEALTLFYEGERYRYAAGLGWLDLEPNLSAPLIREGRVYLGADVLDALGVALPRLVGVRSSGGGTVRVVFDLEELESAQLETLRGSGTLTPARPLTLRLPPLLLPEGLPTRLEGLTFAAERRADATVVELAGPAARYEVFALLDPPRLVVDLTADPDAALAEGAAGVSDAQLDAREDLINRLEGPREGTRELGGGATLRSFVTPTLAGESQVDLVEIAPHRGRFRVQGGSYDLRTPLELTGGALVGLNASYFDPASGRSIGLLKGGGNLASLPSRGRAAVGFGFGRPLIGRPNGRLSVTVGDGPPVRVALQDERVTLHTTPGVWVSSPRQGALVVSASGRVLENKVGPRRVPPGGFVLSYLPEVRDLALVDAGERLSLRLDTRPGVWRFVPEAVEAGPLLVADGRSAYRPEAEAFRTDDPQSSVNRRTTRAALGVRADGTVLLLVAGQLSTAELVPLFLELGAESALQLDSGGSSTLVVGGEVINRPALLQRRVATVITYTPAN